MTHALQLGNLLKLWNVSVFNLILANAARDDMLPYFNETIAQLKNFLTPNKSDDDQENKLKLQVQAIGKFLIKPDMQLFANRVHSNNLN